MPTYEYECTNCKHTFTKFQSMTDKPLKRCPKCRHKVERLIGSGAGIIFKGSGFYETDYKQKRSGYQSAAKSDSKPSATETKSLDASSEKTTSSTADKIKPKKASDNKKDKKEK